MGEEGILMCFAFFSDTKVGMHRTSGSFTSQIAMRYRTFRTLVLVVSFPCQPCYILNIWARGLFSLSIYSTTCRDRSCCMSSTSWKPSPLGKFYLVIITTLF